MGDLHRIRLQAAWDAAAGGGAWTRSFGRPTGVGPTDRIWLVIERPAALAVVLNGRPMPTVAAGVDAWRHDVTHELADRNALRFEVRPPPGQVPAAVRVPLPEAIGIVMLEIETGA